MYRMDIICLWISSIRDLRMQYKYFGLWFYYNVRLISVQRLLTIYNFVGDYPLIFILTEDED